MDLEKRIRLEQTLERITDSFHVDDLKKKTKHLLDKVSNKVGECSDKIAESDFYDGVVKTTERVGNKIYRVTEGFIKRVTK